MKNLPDAVVQCHITACSSNYGESEWQELVRSPVKHMLRVLPDGSKMASVEFGAVASKLSRSE